MTQARRNLLRFEIPLGVLGASLIACAFLFAGTGIPGWIPPAPMLALDIPSPLSGMTRSFVALAQGDVASSLRWHPLGPFLALACITMPVVAVAGVVRGRAVRAPLLGRAGIWYTVAALFVAAWIRQIVVLG